MRDKFVSDKFKAAKAGRRDFLYEHEAKKLCSLYGLPVTKIKVTFTEEEAIDAAREIGYPVVLKIVSPQVLHKSDVGGVLIDIANEDGVRHGFRKIIENVKANVSNAEITGILVQEMAPTGTEIIVGSIMDPTFGPTIMFGLGGIFVEVLKDVSFRLVPIDKMEAEEMIKEIKAYRILEGIRGKPPVDQASIVDILLAASNMLLQCPEIKELDINPVLVYEKGAKIVDARVLL